MKTKFTKGPWYVVPAGFGSIEGANVYYPHGFLTSSNVIPIDETRLDGESWIDMRNRTKKQRKESELESIANMHLIAAAPEMYEMLESVSKELYLLIDEVNDQRMSRVNCQTETPPDLHDQETLHLIQCLLAKARGENV